MLVLVNEIGILNGSCTELVPRIIDCIRSQREIRCSVVRWHACICCVGLRVGGSVCHPTHGYDFVFSDVSECFSSQTTYLLSTHTAAQSSCHKMGAGSVSARIGKSTRTRGT